MKRTVSAILLVMLLSSMLCSAFRIIPVGAVGTIYIRADGSIDPPTTLISTVDNITYILTGNILSNADGIIVQRSNITIDGAAYILQGAGSGHGFRLYGMSNVTIKNTSIQNFTYGVALFSASFNIVSENNITNDWNCGVYLGAYDNNNIISGNTISHCLLGVALEQDSSNNNVSENNIIHAFWSGVEVMVSSNNTVCGNSLTDCSDGIAVFSSSFNTVSGNNITESNSNGIGLYYSSNNNTVSGNNIKNNGDCGIRLADSSYNVAYYNNFIDNTQQVYIEGSSNNIWDNGYPSGGNYWSDYSGVDLFSGPYQNETGSDGISDSPLVIDSVNTDRYPLMNPCRLLTRVLHVSTNMNNEVQRIVDNVSRTAMFMITQVSLPDFNTGVPGILSEFDVIVFGVNNCGEDNGTYRGVYGRTAELKSYVESGGGIIWTHDTLEFGANDYGVNVEGPAGVDYCGAGWVGWAKNKTRILHDHPILHMPFEIGDVGDLIPKTYGPPGCAYDHTSGGIVITAEIIIEHEDASAANNFFLTVNEYGEGRVAVIELGDAMGFDGSYLESTRENQILVNAMYWAAAEPPDIGVTNVTTSKTGCTPIPSVCQNCTSSVDLRIENQGDYPEIFNVTVYANETAIKAFENVTLAIGDSTILSFVWDTNGFGRGNYTISVVVDPVLGEVKTENNEFRDCWIIVTSPGDINADQTVDIFDCASVALAFSSTSSDPNWSPNADINNDGLVDIFDIVVVALHFGETG